MPSTETKPDPSSNGDQEPISNTPIQIKTEDGANGNNEDFFTVDNILPGCKVYATKDGEERLAEILQEHMKKGRKVFTSITKISINV